MALSATILSAAIKAARLANNPTAEVVDNAALQKDCDAIAQAVVGHIQTYAVVTVNPGIHVTTSGGTGATDVPGTGSIT